MKKQLFAIDSPPIPLKNAVLRKYLQNT